MHIAQPCVFDAVLRMRTSAGIRPVEFCGSFMMQNATDVEVSVLTPNTCVTIEVKHDDKLNEEFQAYIQVLCLHSCTLCTFVYFVYIKVLGVHSGTFFCFVYFECFFKRFKQLFEFLDFEYTWLK